MQGQSDFYSLALDDLFRRLPVITPNNAGFKQAVAHGEV